MNDRQVQIRVLNGNQVFFYLGRILEDDSDFILIDDKKEGKIRVNKKFIISMKEGGQNDY